MVLSIQRLGRSLNLSSKLKVHPHQPEASSASLQIFRSDVSAALESFCLNPKPESELLSLPWIRQCLELLLTINRSFAKLVIDMDMSGYPLSKWEAASAEGYLSYSLNMLELLNCIASSLSHLGQSRLSLAHAVSRLNNPPPCRLKPIRWKDFGRGFLEGIRIRNEEKPWSVKEGGVIDQAMIVMWSAAIWACGVAVPSLSGGAKACLEMRKSFNGFVDSSSLLGIDLSFLAEIMEKRNTLQEVEDVNNAVACLEEAVSAGKIGRGAAEAEQLQRNLEVLEKQLEGVQKEVDSLFSEVLAARGQLLQRLWQEKR